MAAEKDGARMLIITTPLSKQLRAGDSVAVNGVCLTVLGASSQQWRARLMAETLAKTNLGDLAVNETVNLEPPLKAGQALDGHLVQGHVDGVCEITDIEKVGDDCIFTFQPPPALLPQLITKGSVSLDGVSLTVVHVSNQDFTVSMMPYTLQMTTFGKRSIHDRVNIEVDMIGRYVQAAVSALAGRTVAAAAIGK